MTTEQFRINFTRAVAEDDFPLNKCTDKNCELTNQGIDRLANIADAQAEPLFDCIAELLEALTAVLATGLNGGDNVRLAFLAAKGRALEDDDLAIAEGSERAVTMARAAIAKAKGGD